jgi:hypothetical protein
VDRHSITRAAAVMALALLAAGCSAAAVNEPPSATDSPSATEVGPSSAPSTAMSQAVASADPRSGPAAGLVVLGGPAGPSLWTYSPSSGWSSQAAFGGAEAIASVDGGVLVVGSDTGEFRPAGDLAAASRSLSLQWPPGSSAIVISALSVSPSGRLAFALSSDGTVAYATATPPGVVSPLETPGSQPFAPLVAWIDDDRRLVLTMHAGQQSRLSVLSEPDAYQELTAVDGCRWFAVSGDGQTIVVATDSAVLVGDTQAWLSNEAPAQVAAIASGDIVWNLAVDASGRRLALLSGAVGEDGAVAAPRELVYERTDGSWTLSLDVAAPSAGVLGQAWAG